MSADASLKILGWAGTVCVLVGRLFFVYDLPELGFTASIVGDLLWLTYGIKASIYSLAFLDIVLLGADLLGALLHPLW